MNNLMNDLKEKAQGVNKKRVAKITGLTFVALALLGGGTTFAYKMYERAEDKRENVARSQLVQSQAQTENVSLKTEAEIKDVVAKSIGADVNSIYFEGVYLANDARGYERGHRGFGRDFDRDFDDRFDNDRDYDDRYDRDYDDVYERGGRVAQPSVTTQTTTADANATTSVDSTTQPVVTTANQSNATSTQVSANQYVYVIDAEYNSLDYDFLVDAKTGQILSSRVDN